MGLPLIKGPYGRITAINLNTGDHAWMIPNGKPADNLVNNPALKAAGIDASNWGGGQRSPILVTKTLLFEGSDTLRVIDKKTGAADQRDAAGREPDGRHDDLYGQWAAVHRGGGGRAGTARGRTGRLAIPSRAKADAVDGAGIGRKTSRRQDRQRYVTAAVFARRCA